LPLQSEAFEHEAPPSPSDCCIESAVVESEAEPSFPAPPSGPECDAVLDPQPAWSRIVATMSKPSPDATLCFGMAKA